MKTSRFFPEARSVGSALTPETFHHIVDRANDGLYSYYNEDYPRTYRDVDEVLGYSGNDSHGGIVCTCQFCAATMTKIFHEAADERDNSRHANPPPLHRTLMAHLHKKGFNLHSRVGDLLGEYNSNMTVRFRKPPFDWKPGDFADKRSCFFQKLNGSNRFGTILPWMEANGFLAAQFHAENGKGLARCWIYPVPKKAACIVLNAYGLRLEIVADRIARALNLTNHGIHTGRHHDQYAGTFYINLGKVAVLGAPELKVSSLFSGGGFIDFKKWLPSPPCTVCSICSPYWIEHEEQTLCLACQKERGLRPLS